MHESSRRKPHSIIRLSKYWLLSLCTIHLYLYVSLICKVATFQLTYSLPQVGRSRMQLIWSPGGSESGVGSSDGSEFSASPFYEVDNTAATPNPHPPDQCLCKWVFYTSSGIKYLSQATGPGRDIYQWLLLEDGEGVISLFYLMFSEPGRWRAKEILA